MADTISARETTTRAISYFKKLEGLAAGVVIKVEQDGVELASYTVPESKVFTGGVAISGSEVGT